MANCYINVMSSLLIHGGTKESRKDKALAFVAENGVDSKHVRIIDEKKMGIDIIKEMVVKAHVRSQGSGKKAVVILEAQRLTKPAQNALLKTLEEPPAHVTIILTAPSPKLLLPTIVSRCLVTEAQSRAPSPPARPTVGPTGGETQKEGLHLQDGREDSLEVGGFIQKLLTAAPGKRLAMFEEEIGYDKDDVFEFFDEVEAYFQKDLLRKDPAGKTLRVGIPLTRRVEECGVKVSQRLQHLWRSKKLLHDETANVKLVVDEWLLSW